MIGQFKSLTFRIWATFSLFALIIIFTISAIYLVIVRNAQQSARKETLAVAHELALQQKESGETHFNPEDFKALTSDIDFKTLGEVGHLALYYEPSNESLTVSPLIKPHMPDQSSLMTAIGNWSFHLIEKDHLTAESFYKKFYKGSFHGDYFLIMASSLHLSETNYIYLVSFIGFPQRLSTLYTFIGIGLVFILIALLASKVISNSISKPLKNLEKQVQKIANKDWIEPLPITTGDEIGSLITSINEMQAALQKADQEERRFLQSISHDLKTPIMVIMGHAEAIIDGMYVDSLENTAQIIKSEAQRLDTKVKQILYYNTLDYALDNEQYLANIDVSKLLASIISRFERINPHIAFQVTLKPLFVYCNAERLQVALENILENQLRYAANKIRIVLRADGENAILHISNNGPPIEEDKLPHIFDEFYKGTSGNFGLGLAITKKIILFYKGSVNVSNEAFGVLFKVTLPLAQKL